jgi:hypothetical protein
MERWESRTTYWRTNAMGKAIFPVCSSVVLAIGGGLLQDSNIARAQTSEPLLKRTENYYTTPNRLNQSQITSISEFVDVKPTDWVFQALQSLVEHYGCIAGYPTTPPPLSR